LIPVEFFTEAESGSTITQLYLQEAFGFGGRRKAPAVPQFNYQI